MAFQAVVLAGGSQKRLYPLTQGCSKALLPVGNRPLLSYPMKMLAEAGVKKVIVVAMGEQVAISLQNWLAQEYPQQGGGLQHEVVVVPEEFGTAEALRVVAPKVTTDVFVVTTGDLVSDVALSTIVLQHKLNEALATVLLTNRKSPMSETKPGIPPKAVDYIGLDETQTKLLFHTSSPDTLSDLKMPLATMRKYGRISVRTNLLDTQVYIFSRKVLDIMGSSKTPVLTLKYDLIPLLIKHTMLANSAPQPPPPEDPARLPRVSSNDDENGSEAALPGADYERMLHWAGDVSSSKQQMEVYMAPEGCYCARVNSVEAYGDINREVVQPEVWQALTGAKPSAGGENVPPATVQIGNKSTIGTGCMLGENTSVGEKSSIKRSVIGNNCRLGQSVKVINCVLMDNVSVEAGSSLQNCIICSGAVIQERCNLKDCQVGPGYQVSEGVDFNKGVLAKKLDQNLSMSR